MAETHQEIVKVWIEPGCIVCDACESDSPEVFEVLEDTCIIRKPALDAAFTQARTPSIVEAAEGCPVDVIKYDTIEVEGPEPWAGEEEEETETAGAGAGSGGGAKKKSGWEPPEGPPEPQWAGLLSAAHTSGSRSSGGPAVTMRPAGRPAAKAPVEAVGGAVDPNAPPDAMAATMIGAGYSRPATNVAEDIRKRGRREGSVPTRRQFSMALAAGWGGLLAVAGTMGAVFQSFLIPKVSKEPPSKVRAGKLADFAEVGVYNQFKSENFWIVNLPEGQLIATSTICTHLGCIPNWLQNDLKFKCPCHGSGFTMEGINFEGPAPRPLERHKIWLEGDVVMVDKAFIYREELGQWTDGNSFLTV